MDKVLSNKANTKRGYGHTRYSAFDREITIPANFNQRENPTTVEISTNVFNYSENLIFGNS